MSRLLIYTANFGNFDKRQENVEQSLPEGIERIDYWRCTESDFPLRDKALTPRLQARLVKMFGWQFKPDYDFYLWVDSSCRLPREDSVKWFMGQLGQSDIAVFKHNRRENVQQEADYLKDRLKLEAEGRKQFYVLPRYENEDIDGQLAAVDPEARLFASTAFIYRNTLDMQSALSEWWYHTSRFHLIDQLSLPFVIKGMSHNVIEEDYLKCQYLQYQR